MRAPTATRREAKGPRGAARALVAAAALGLSSLGCSSPLLVCPRRGGDAWTAVETPHFSIKTDIPRSDARAEALELERLYDALSKLLGRPADRSSAKSEVVVFTSPNSFHAFDDEGDLRSAYFTGKLPFDVEPTPTLVLYRGDDDSHEHFLHELTHRFLHERFADLPMWLDEGLAELYETFRLDGRRGVLGAPSRRPAAAALWTTHYALPGGGLLPLDSIPPLATLVQADRDTFYATNYFGPLRQERMHGFYAGAFRFVHLLVNGRNAEYRARFQTYLGALDRGEKPSKALYDAFTGVDPAALERDYRAHVAASTLPVQEIDFGAQGPAPTVVPRSMSDGEVHVLWSRLYPAKKETRRYVLGELDLALAHEPSSVEARVRRALVLAADQRFHDANAEISTALAARPGDPRLLLARLQVYAQINPPAYACGEREPALDAIIEQLSRVAVTASELDAVATYHESHGQAALGLPFAAAAVQRGPLCWHCQDTHARLLVQTGNLQSALSAAARAKTLLPEDAEEAEVDRAKALLASVSALADASTAPRESADGKGPATPGAVIASSLEAFYCCLQLARREAPTLAGDATLSIAANTSGVPTNATVRSSTMGSPAMERCLVRQAAKLRFPPRETTTMTYAIPLHLKPPPNEPVAR